MEKEKNNPDYTPKSDKIQNRNSILKTIIISVFSVLIAYKLAISELNFDFSKFDFSDLLSLILALFSIGLAVTFYFKATDTSNNFYDNTYKFTKDISGILGRIEAGFGEKLKHLDEGYTGLVDKFSGDSIKVKSDSIEKVKKELEDEKERLEKEMDEKNEILSQLMTKANLNAHEREEFSKRINAKDEEINNLSSELKMLKRRLMKTEKSRDSDLLRSIPPHLIEILQMFIRRDSDPIMIMEAPHEYLMQRLDRPLLERYSEREIHELRAFGVINDEYKFTPMGVELLKSIAKRHY